jgi:hypothetical protein
LIIAVLGGAAAAGAVLIAVIAIVVRCLMQR